MKAGRAGALTSPSLSWSSHFLEEKVLELALALELFALVFA